MRPHCVVMPTPGFDDDAGIAAVAEPFQAQQFVPELAVEAFPGAILPWLAGIDGSVNNLSIGPRTQYIHQISSGGRIRVLRQDISSRRSA